ncbi:MAG: hypothetical protein JWM55_495 [Acidimicrobiaceae bacterium]|nr:hypothetical protein [Acidimicrobiaceae bacterium]
MVVTTVSLAGSLGSSAWSLSSATPSITITPSIGLSNNQQITIDGTGFAPSQTSLVALECDRTATSPAGCSATSVPLSVNPVGQFTSTLTVTTGAIGNGTCGTTTTDAACEIAVASTSTNSFVTLASIAFASGPGVALAPSTNLHNGETVTITGVDFTPGDKVYALECLTGVASEAACDTGTATPITVSATGTLPSTSFKVVTGTVGNGTCGTNVSNYNRCLIEVAAITHGDAGYATLDFSAPATTVSLAPTATHVAGYAVPGRSADVAVQGKNFSAGPKVVARPGTVVSVLSHTSTRIVLKISEAPSVKRGTYRLTIDFANGAATSFTYRVN